MCSYAKVVVLGSPITKSNFKLHNKNGRAILPYNTGKYTDRYAIYEQEIAYAARSQNPQIVLDESLIAILKVYYKSSKRHPDTINITKSIFDGIEKSGLIVNDAQITKIITEEFYDEKNPRFELELFGESSYTLSYTTKKREVASEKITYLPIKKSPIIKNLNSTNNDTTKTTQICTICQKVIKNKEFITADKGKTLICNSCFKKSF
ncbi:MAG: RusA family crossover junction endodeoxyribonuclease [Clostridium sp.]|nr:RusA family crossover junction endodeoxyribonuclease [Clostridium sp.]MDY3828739.1 RusA family crossover junction endodeoxyribonuclease [Clostridium sp.]